MKLHINDFMRIKKAEIEIDRITVIAGNNNTGKSTIGKALFIIFYSLFELDKKNISEKASFIIDNILESIQALWKEDLIKNIKLTDFIIKLLDYELRNKLIEILRQIIPLYQADPSKIEDIIQLRILEFLNDAKIELDGPIKTIAYGSDKNKWAFQQQFPDGVILSLGISETEIFYDYYDGKTWTRKWTR